MHLPEAEARERVTWIASILRKHHYSLLADWLEGRMDDEGEQADVAPLATLGEAIAHRHRLDAVEAALRRVGHGLEGDWLETLASELVVSERVVTGGVRALMGPQLAGGEIDGAQARERVRAFLTTMLSSPSAACVR